MARFVSGIIFRIIENKKQNIKRGSKKVQHNGLGKKEHKYIQGIYQFTKEIEKEIKHHKYYQGILNAGLIDKAFL
ncbi:hypothetical protein ACFL40_02825 [candidate division KSB1 bacterium]